MPKIIIEIGKGQNADQVLASLKAQLGSVSDSVTLLGENTRRLEREQRNAERSFRQTAAALDPAIAKSQEYERAQKALDEALKRNIITQQEHARLLALAKERHDDNASGLSVLIARYGSGATAVAAFAAALAGSLAVLDQVQQFVSASISSAAESERVQAQINARIASTGGAAELTASQLAEMGNELQNLSKFDDESLAGAQNVLLTFTSISGDTFREALSAVTDMSTALGTDLASNARLVGKALEDPVKGLIALSRAGIVFSTSQKEVIQSLVESGDLMGAQDLILASLAERFGGAAAADVATFGGSIDRVNNLWDNFQEKVGEGVLPILSSFLSSVGNIIAGNDELAETLGTLIELGGRAAMVLISGAAEAGEYWLGLAADVMNAIASIVESVANGAESIADFFGIDWNAMLVDGLREAAAGQRENAEIAEALARASGQVSDAALLAAINLGRKGAAAKAGAKDSREHALADEEAAKEAEAFAKGLRALLDDLDPIGKAEREAVEGIQILNRALSEGMAVADYQAAIGQLIQKLNDARAAALGLGEAVKLELIDMPSRLLEIVPDQVIPVPVELVIEGGSTEFERESSAIAERFGESMEAGLLSAGETFFAELMAGGDDAWEHLGENLTQVLLQSVAEWLAAQLLAIAKAAIAAKAIQAGTGGGGVGSAASGLSGAGGGFGSLGIAGNGAGAASFTSAFAAVAWAAVAAAAVIAIAKFIKDTHDAKQYGTEVRVDDYGDSNAVGTEVRGRLHATGGLIAQGIEGLLHAIESAAGVLIEDMPGIEVKIRNDKELFSVWVGEQFVGQFKSAQEAMMAAALQAFQKSTFESELEPVFAGIIENFRGSDPQQLIEALQKVRAVMDEVSGISQIEINIRDIDNAAAALREQLVGVGVGFNDAAEIAENWKIRQFQNLRDQITGHQQTEAEQRAEFERQRAMFNAKLALEKLDVQTQIEAVDAKLAIVAAGGQLLSADLVAQANYLQTKADIYGQGWALEGANLENMAAANNVSIEILMAMRASLGEAMAALEQIRPIDASEFRPQGGSGRGGGHSGRVDIDTGPTEAELRVQAFLDYLENVRLDGLSEYQRRLEEIDATYAEQRQTLDEMIAASDGSAESTAQLAAQEAALAQARADAAAALREDVIDGLGLPLEGVRDRMEEIRGQVEAWFASGQEMVDRFLAGEISMNELMAALEEANGLWAEFGDLARSSLMNLALYFTDALGDTEASAAIRAELAEMEWDFKRIEMQLLVNTYHELGLITDAVFDRWNEFITNLPENLPTTPGTPAEESGAADPLAWFADAIDSLGLPMEAVRDRIAGIAASIAEFASAEARLNADLASGAITAEEYAAAMQRIGPVWMEVAQQAQASISEMALYFLDAQGETEQAAQLRRELAEMEWDLKRAEMAMLLEMYHLAGAISSEDFAHWMEFLNALPEDAPVLPGEATDPLAWLTGAIDGLGLPLEGVRDRLAGIAASIAEFASAEARLTAQFAAGEITLEQYAEAMQQVAPLWQELADQAQASISEMALYFLDAQGETEQAAQLRRELAEMEWDLRRAEFRMLLEMYALAGAISDEDFAHWMEFIDALPDTLPDMPDHQTPQPGYNNGYDAAAAAAAAARDRREQALISALDRLRGALDSYKAFRENLATGPLSGDTLEQRTGAAAGQWEAMLAQAQGGDVSAIQNLPAMANQYLELLSQFIDPSSAQYQQIRAQVLAEMAGIEGGIAGLLSGANNPNAGVEAGLGTIADILNEIRQLWGGSPTWNPGPRSATVYPGPFPGQRDTRELSSGSLRSGSPIEVTDQATQRSISRMEAKLEFGLANVSRATNRQTSKQSDRKALGAAQNRRRFGNYDRDEAAS